MDKEPLYGDITEIKEGIIVHGCNCMGVMGAGVALQLKNKYPAIYTQYMDLVDKVSVDRLLGNIQVVSIHDKLEIINAFTQFKYGIEKCQIDYDVIISVFRKIRQYYLSKYTGDYRPVIYYPKIGAGLAGGDWSVISRIINGELGDINHRLVLL